MIGLDRDHLHMVISIPPEYRIASVMGKLKSDDIPELRMLCSVVKVDFFDFFGFSIDTVAFDKCSFSMVQPPKRR